MFNFINSKFSDYYPSSHSNVDPFEKSLSNSLKNIRFTDLYRAKANSDANELS